VAKFLSSADAGLIAGQFIKDSWWTKWHSNRFFS